MSVPGIPVESVPRWPPAEVLEALADRGLEEAEVYLKSGRSRRLEISLHTESSSFHQERGWAVRASGPRASLFVCGSGDPSPAGPWPEPDGHPLRLPDPVAVPEWKPPPDFDAPLSGEREGLELLGAIGRELDTELPGARLIHGLLEDGSSESEIHSLRGVDGRWRSRVATLRLTAAVTERGSRAVSASLSLAEREPRRFQPKAVARRLADRLVVRGAPPPDSERERGRVLLSPEVARRLLAALGALWVGPRAPSRAGRFEDRRGRLGGELLTVVDDGRRAGGLLTAPVDGEGLPTREITLVERGMFRQPLVAWDQIRGSEMTASGCARRASWRDLPEPGPTHLYLAPGTTPVAELVTEVRRGHYFIEATGPVRVDFEQDVFALPVAGFALGRGQGAVPVSGALLRGAVSALLHNFQALGRDLTFAPEEGGVLGAPSVLVGGLEVGSRTADR